MRHIIAALFLISIIICPKHLFGQFSDTASIGIFVTRINHFNINADEYNTEFWVWINSNDSSITEISKEIGFRNCIKESFSSQSYGRTKNNPLYKYYAGALVKGEFIHNWQVSRFPFDKQNLQIMIESFNRDRSHLILIPDKEGSGYDPLIGGFVDGWVMKDGAFDLHSKSMKYKTNFGESPENKSEYSVISYSILFERVEGLFYKLFLGLYISFAISVLVFLVDSNELESKCSLSVAGLFGAVGNKYIIDGLLPNSPINTLCDTIHNFTFMILWFIALFSIVDFKLSKMKSISERRLNIINWSGFIGTILIYIIGNIYIVTVMYSE
jgi:hypothetical protein